MSRKSLACLVLLCALVAQSAFAAPILTVNSGPVIAGNRLWFVDVAPDPSLFSGGPPVGGSMAVELAFKVDTAQLVDVDVNTAAWDTENPGNNPFTGTVTDGLWLDLIGDRTFGAFGSIRFTSGDPVRLFNIKTSSEFSATLRFGSSASGSQTLGALIAQAGQGFTGYGGIAKVVPEPATGMLALASVLACALLRRRR